MRRKAALILGTVFLLNACIPTPFLQPPTATPVVDSQATEAALAATSAMETLNALPTPTLVPVTDTLAPTATEPPTATELATETAAPETATPMSALPTETLAGATATAESRPRFYGTLPPAIPYGEVTLSNRAKVDVYVSLQCTTIDGYKTVIEYPVSGSFEISAPAGSYNYVAWVGGRQFLGSFRLSKDEDLAILFQKDKVTIK